MSEEKIRYYLNEQMTKPLPPHVIDFGEIDSDGSSTVTIYVINYDKKTVRDIEVSSFNDAIEVVEHPSELKRGGVGKIVLKWIPLQGKVEDLKASLIIKGKLFRGE